MLATDRSTQSGQAVALFALALGAIVLGAAVVIDGGYAFAQRRQSQNAADFAAMAGTRIVGQALTGNPPGAGTAANVENAINATLAANDAVLVEARYVDETGADLGPVVGAVSIPNDAFGVVVDARTAWQPFLLGVIGITDWGATSTATALTPGRSEGGAVMPVGISEDTYNALLSCPYTSIDACSQQPLTPGHQIGPGSFGWLSFGLQGNGGKCDWEYSLGMKADGGCQVNQPFLQSQIWPDPNPHGCCTAVGSIDDEGRVSEDKIGALTGNEWGDLTHYIEGPDGSGPIPVWVPIYRGELQDQGSKAYYDIVGFGAIIFLDEDGTQHAKWLKGAAIQTPWCWGVDEDTGLGDRFCQGPGGSFKFDVTGEVQLRR